MLLWVWELVSLLGYVKVVACWRWIALICCSHEWIRKTPNLAKECLISLAYLLLSPKSLFVFSMRVKILKSCAFPAHHQLCVPLWSALKQFTVTKDCRVSFWLGFMLILISVVYLLCSHLDLIGQSHWFIMILICIAEVNPSSSHIYYNIALFFIF